MKAITIHNYEAFLLDYFEGNLSLEDTTLLKTFLAHHPELKIDLNDTALPALDLVNFSFNQKDTLKKSNLSVHDEELLEYLEKTLSQEQRHEFELKLKTNLPLQELLAAYKKTYLSPDSECLAEKEILLKTEDDFILSDKSLLYYEGLMNTHDTKEFEANLHTDFQLKNDLALLLKSKLEAALSIVYPSLSELKKEPKIIALFRYRKIAAIAATIIFLLGLFLLTQYSTQETQVPANTIATSTPARSITNPTNEPSLAIRNSTSKNTNEFKQRHQGKTITNQSTLLTRIDTQTTKELMVARQVGTNTQSDSIKISPMSNVEPNNLVNTLTQNDSIIKDAEINSKQQPSALSSHNSVQNTNIFYEVIQEDEDEEVLELKQNKNKFWDKIVQLAKKANKIGLKQIDLEERSNNSFILSFNSITVEKK